jgi:hypothetical protein
MKDQLTPYLPSLLQLQSGLNSSGLLDTMKKNPNVWEALFRSSNSFEMTVDDFLDELKVQYSSSQRQKDLEVSTFKFFCDVIENLERSRCYIYNVYQVPECLDKY